MLDSSIPFAQPEPIFGLPQPLWQKIIIQPLVVSPKTATIAAISLMCEARLDLRSIEPVAATTSRNHPVSITSCIIIVEARRPIGILTATDIVRLTASRQDLEQLAICDVMKSPLVTLRQSAATDLDVAIDLLDRHQIRHLPIVDEEDCLVGLVTRDLLHHHLAAVAAAQLEQQSCLADRAAIIALQESQQFLETVIETFPLAVFWKDRESRYLGCNQNFARDAGLTMAEIIGKTDYDLPWGSIEGAAYRADDRETIDSGRPKLGIIETQAQTDGSSIWVETNKLPLRNIQGETIGVLGTYQDITERRRNETQLQKLSERLSLSLKSGAFGCWEWDILQDCYIWDDRMYELYGQVRSNHTSTLPDDRVSWMKTIHPEDRQAIEKKLAQALMKVAEFDTEFRVIHPDGSIHFLKAYGLVEYDERDRPCRMIGINFDISVAKHDEAIRQQTEQTISQQADREFVLREMTQRIRKSLELPIVFETAVREIRGFLATDRVGIFQFKTDCHHAQGKFVAESVATEFRSILGSTIYDPDFARKFFRYYRQGYINAVEDIYAAGLQESEVQVLARYQVRAHLVVPLLNGPDLWGLLCVHHCRGQRAWQEIEIEFIKHIGEQIGIGIQQATLYEKVQSELQIRWRAEEAIALQLRQQRTLGAIAQQIRNSLKVEEILATASKQVKELMLVDRVAIFQIFPDGHLRAVEEVVSPAYPSLVNIDWERDPFSQDEIEFYAQGQPRIVVDVMQDLWSSRLQECEVMAGVQSKIVAPILLPCEDNEATRQFDPSDRVQLWGLLSIHACSDRRQWQESEAQLLQQIADQLAIAIQQATLFELLQAELAERQQAETQLRERNQQLAISNQELARATQLKDEFLANMSHELRTPLNAILGMSEALQTAVFGHLNQQQQNALATIEKSGKHLLSLINDILDLSKIEANKFVLELTDVSIQSLCQNSLLFVQELANKRQILLTTQLPTSLQQLTIRVDELRCRQVLINLLSNAVKFTPEGGSVTLDVRVLAGDAGRDRGDLSLVTQTDHSISIGQLTAIPTSRQIVFSIVDTGIGIAPENISKLFQSFVQIDSSLNRQYAGTGLGLALVKRIVELHGGVVTVESELQQGSCFAIYLPFDPSLETEICGSAQSARIEIADLRQPEQQELLTQNKATILVVEDNEANMETMTGYLQSRGYRLLGASNGRQGIDMAQRHVPDAILMDIQMPDLDGFEAIECIRQLPECMAIPIIALTALAMPADRQRCLDAGADRYVTKPVKLGQLVSTIETLLHSS